MAIQNQSSQIPEWLFKVPAGSSVKIEQEKYSWFLCLWLKCKAKVVGFAKIVWDIGADDPRKVIHCVKVGLALALVSIFYYTRPLYDGVGGAAMWAVMTVVVVLEFTVGGSLYKGLNRTTATLSAGALACGIHWLASKSGETMEHIILGTSVFILSSAATFSRFIMPIKVKFDYGITIFILTFNLVAVSSYRVDNLIALAQKRISTIAIGVSICLIIAIIVFPVWAGEDLHNLIIRNMEKLADSLEYSVAEYFKDSEKTEAEKSSYQKSQGYKSILNSKSSEDCLENLAKWEPSHGTFKLKHPWNQYLKIGTAMRYCAHSIETLNGFIGSETQVPGHIKLHFADACTKLGLEYARVLKESANSLKTMKKSSAIELMVAEMNDAVEEVHTVLRSLQANGEERKRLVIEALPLISVISLLIEISARIEGVVDTVEDLGEIAGFGTDEDEKGDEVKAVAP